MAQNPWVLYPRSRMAADESARTRELAALAHLELCEADAATFGAQLEKILGYVRRLQSVDVDGVPEWLTAEHPCSGLRGDDVGPTFEADRALAGAPALRDRLIAVPKFLHTQSG
jgi:aspartyl-tRNA(Asn)/glutamyl-tRNA(Gln) amidotransferase subunit C